MASNNKEDINDSKSKMKLLRTKLRSMERICTDPETLYTKVHDNSHSLIFNFYKKEEDLLFQETWFIRKNCEKEEFGAVTAVDINNKIFATLTGKSNIETNSIADNYVWNKFYKADSYDIPSRNEMNISDDIQREYEKTIYAVLWTQRNKKENEFLARKKNESDMLNRSVKPVSGGFIDFMEKLPFHLENRLFYKDGRGYCTRCRNEMILEGKIRHLSYGKCPVCGKKVLYTSRNRNHKSVYDTRYAMLIQKSCNDYIVIRYFRVEAEVCGTSIRPTYYKRELVRSFVKHGKVRDYKHISDEWVYCKNTRCWDGYRCINVGLNFGYFSAYGGIYTKGLSKLIKNSDFLKHIEFEEYLKNNLQDIKSQHKMIRCIGEFIERHAMEKYLEWISKSGFKYLRDKVWNDSGSISLAVHNIRGKTLPDVLGIDRQTYRRIYQIRDTVTPQYIKIARDFPTLKKEEWDLIDDNFSLNYFDKLKNVLRYTTLNKAYKYIMAQSASSCDKYNTLTLWSDYIDMRNSYGEWNRKSNLLLFPKYLKTAHDEIMNLNREKEKKEARKANMERLKKMYHSLGLTDEEWLTSEYSDVIDPTQIDRLPVFFKLDKILPDYHKKYDFKPRKGELFITAPIIAYDIVTEGEEQSICVGRKEMKYIENMADNKTTILFIRNRKHPDRPYFTVEIKNNVIKQVRGKANCSPKNDVKDFLKYYAKKKKIKYEDAIA